MRYDFTHVYLKSWWYDLQFWRIRVWQTKIGNYESVFALLTPTPHPAKNPKKSEFCKDEKIAGDIILLMRNKNHNHMRYGFWDGVRQTNFFVRFGHFLPFYPPNNPINQNFEKIKNAYYTCILYMCTKTSDHMVFASWDMGATHNFLSFWVIFWPFTPLLTTKIRNWKK